MVGYGRTSEASFDASYTHISQFQDTVRVKVNDTTFSASWVQCVRTTRVRARVDTRVAAHNTRGLAV